MAKNDKSVTAQKEQKVPRRNRCKATRAINSECVLDVADNSGAFKLKMIGTTGLAYKLNRMPRATVGDCIIGTCCKACPELRKKIHPAVIIRIRKSIKRSEGVHVRFDDNACVLIDGKGEPIGSMINGPVAREAATIWPKIAAHAPSIN